MSIMGGAQIASAALSHGTSAVISFGTATGFKYDLQTSTNLAGAWSTVVSNIPGTGGTMILTNSITPGAVNQYYRLGSVPPRP